jgi:hypothetical protein
VTDREHERPLLAPTVLPFGTDHVAAAKSRLVDFLGIACRNRHNMALMPLQTFGSGVRSWRRAAEACGLLGIQQTPAIVRVASVEMERGVNAPVAFAERELSKHPSLLSWQKHIALLAIWMRARRWWP